MKKSSCITNFLRSCTHADLAALYTPNLEVQVNVARDGGEKVQSEFEGRTWVEWTDGIERWKAFRIPRDANTVPIDNDSELRFDLTKHAEGIGSTGWDWKNLVSRWVAFDFDSITTHKAGLSTEKLAEVLAQASAIPWVTVRKSSSGSGYHLYVFFDPPIPTTNHTQHAALARAILGKMSGTTGFDFQATVDCCGGNVWIWHRKMVGNDGLRLVKQGIPLDDVPANWKDNIKVVTGKTQRKLPFFVEEDSSGQKDKMTDFFDQMNRVPLDENHRRLIDWLDEHKTGGWWDADNHLLITHTVNLKQAHTELGLRGLFETTSVGKDAPGDVNCFLYPLRRGGWVVRRYTMGIHESPTWDQDGVGWTRCYFNCEPDLRTVARAKGGIESTSGDYSFRDADTARDVATMLGAVIPELPPQVLQQPTILKEHKDGRLIFAIDEPASKVNMPGWLFKKNKMTQIFRINPSEAIESDTSNYDAIVRHLSLPDGKDQGWVFKTEDGVWRAEPLNHVQIVLQAMGLSHKEIVTTMGSSISKCWKIVDRPFQPEFPGNREWNRNAAQFRFPPSQDLDQLSYPTWKQVLAHTGRGLDDIVKTNPWAMVNGITTGGDYLKIWCASLFKDPYQPLPYLFLYSEEEDSGKTTFHEALSLLLTKGYVRADTALINEQGFSGELAGAILCIVEETDLSKAKNALNRMKDLVTSRDISIHPKGCTPYLTRNITHWVQCANKITYCPTFPGDTRITMIQVPPLDIEEMIPKKEIIPLLEAEAPDFMAALLAVEIPASNSRLNVPILSTAEKRQAQESNRNPLEQFIVDIATPAPGYMLRVADFYQRFASYAEPADLHYWTKNRVGREFPSRFAKGRDPQNGASCYGNIAWQGDDISVPRPRLKAVQRGDLTFLVPENTGGRE